MALVQLSSGSWINPENIRSIGLSENLYLKVTPEDLFKIFCALPIKGEWPASDDFKRSLVDTFPARYASRFNPPGGYWVSKYKVLADDQVSFLGYMDGQDEDLPYKTILAFDNLSDVARDELNRLVYLANICRVTSPRDVIHQYTFSFNLTSRGLLATLTNQGVNTEVESLPMKLLLEEAQPHLEEMAGRANYTLAMESLMSQGKNHRITLVEDKPLTCDEVIEAIENNPTKSWRDRPAML